MSLFSEEVPLPLALPPIEVKMEESWKQALQAEFCKPYFHQLIAFVKAEVKSAKKIYPPGSLIFNAFELTPLRNVKVVLLGQDPYMRYGQAHGLSFSVPHGVKIPESLKNIYKELEDDLGIAPATHGNLEYWAQQGVLLLNTVLTVEEGTSNSHAKRGWENFTDAAIKVISEELQNVVFLLWGAPARAKSVLVDHSKHLILEAAHPSPLARGAYFGSKHFSKTNAYLTANNLSPVDWRLPV